jgi:hypothetical protein
MYDVYEVNVFNLYISDFMIYCLTVYISDFMIHCVCEIVGSKIGILLIITCRILSAVLPFYCYCF